MSLLLRRGTTTEWTTSNPVLAAGEPGYDTTAGVLKIGNGSTPWTGLRSWLLAPTVAGTAGQVLTVQAGGALGWGTLTGVTVDPGSGGSGLTAVNNGDGTVTVTGPAAVDNGHGTVTFSSGAVDNGDGTITL